MGINKHFQKLELFLNSAATTDEIYSTYQLLIYWLFTSGSGFCISCGAQRPKTGPFSKKTDGYKRD